MNQPLDEKWLPGDNGTGEGGAIAHGADVPTAPLDGMRPAAAAAVPRVPVDDLERRLRRMTRRGFALGGAAALAGFAGWRWLVTRSEEDGLPWPLRRVLEFNERVARGLSRTSRLSPEFPRTAARMPRVNGSIGLESDLDPSAWRLRVVGPAGEGEVLSLVHSRRNPGPSPGRDDDRATLHRGLERRGALGRRPARRTSPRSRNWRPAVEGRPTRATVQAACSATPRWRHPTAATTSGSTWPAPSIPRPSSATRWTAGP